MARLVAVLVLAVLTATAVPRWAPAATAVGLGPTPGAHSAGLLWGGKRFVTRRAFDRWLKPRSLSYAKWADKHPAGRLILAGGLQRPQPAPTPPTSPSPAPAHVSPSIVRAAPRVVVSAPAASRGHAELLLALAAAALVLGALALAPLQRLAPSSPLTNAVAERRAALSVLACAILLGILVAKLAS
jgi:hypothetical protein